MKFTVEKHGEGIRYVKEYRKARWRSSTYPTDSRANLRAAKQLFVEWRDRQPKPPTKDDRISELEIEKAELERQLVGSRPEHADFVEQTQSEIADLRAEINIQRVAKQRGINLDQDRKTKADIERMIPPDIRPQEVSDYLQHEHLRGEPTPDERLVDFWAKRFLDITKAEKDRSPGGWSNVVRNFGAFTKFVGDQTDVETIEETKWESFFIHCRDNFGDAKTKDCLAIARKFIKYLYQQRQIELPRNIDNYSVTIEEKAIQHFTLEELQSLLANTEGFLKCCVCLMANCGFTQIDIATLTPSMLQDGYIIRQRHKKKKGENLPTVKWKLWQSTKDLIEQHRTDTNGLLFTRPDGLTWYVNEERKDNNGKTVQSKDDRISELFKEWRKEHPQRLTMKYIRKTSANLLSGNLSLQTKFLAHKPKGTAALHYVEPSQPKFDRAVMELEKKLNA